jgi:hypothetical protein
MNIDYKNKYLKYKKKYIELKGGSKPRHLSRSKTYLDSVEIDGIHIQNSASKSLIVKCNYNGTIPLYCKLFYESQINLLFEKKIYEYIKEEYIKNPLLADHFIISLYTFIKPICTIKQKFKNENDIKMFKDFNEANNENNKYVNIHGIFTNDYKYNSFEELIKSTTDAKDIDFLIFELLYSIYIMHTQLDIMHNDLHFGNILATKILNPEIYEYLINGKTYKFLKKYKVLIFDFDRSTKIQKFTDTPPDKNDILSKNYCKVSGSCNKYSQKDIFVLIVSLMNFKYRKDTHINETHVDKIFNIISNNDTILKTAIINNLFQNKKDTLNEQRINELYKKDKSTVKIEKYYNSLKFKKSFWSAHCEIQKNNDIDKIRFIADGCDSTNMTNLDIIEVIERYIKYLSLDPILINELS